MVVPALYSSTQSPGTPWFDLISLMRITGAGAGVQVPRDLSRTPLFGVMVGGTLILVAALTFFPALALGPIAEALS